jgi:hypothetical protein
MRTKKISCIAKFDVDILALLAGLIRAESDLRGVTPFQINQWCEFKQEGQGVQTTQRTIGNPASH